jgi:DNA-binding transcriptional MerR regulator
MKRVESPQGIVSPAHLDGGRASQPVAHFAESELAEIETRCGDEGLSTQEVVELFSARGERLTEATFRKYVQLGLLPRSVRVGRKGKHRGSQGRYPATVVRQIDSVRRLMAQGYTIQDIQNEFVGLRTDVDALGRQLISVLGTMEQVVSESAPRAGDEIAARAIAEARQLAEGLIEKLRAIEQRLAMRARMARAAV